MNIGDEGNVSLTKDLYNNFLALLKKNNVSNQLIGKHFQRTFKSKDDNCN